jgi:hypothetical protein
MYERTAILYISQLSCIAESSEDVTHSCQKYKKRGLDAQQTIES